jgi:hypothetical protein
MSSKTQLQIIRSSRAIFWDKLFINLSKTYYILFQTKHCRQESNLKILIESREISNVKSTNWHIKDICQKCLLPNTAAYVDLLQELNTKRKEIWSEFYGQHWLNACKLHPQTPDDAIRRPWLPPQDMQCEKLRHRRTMWVPIVWK